MAHVTFENFPKQCGALKPSQDLRAATDAVAPGLLPGPSGFGDCALLSKSTGARALCGRAQFSARQQRRILIPDRLLALPATAFGLMRTDLQNLSDLLRCATVPLFYPAKMPHLYNQKPGARPRPIKELPHA